jgi:hypothetical protein
MIVEISAYISSLISDRVSKLIGKNKSLLFDTEDGMLYYLDKHNQPKLLPDNERNLKKLDDLIEHYCNPYTDFEYNIPRKQCALRKPIQKSMKKREKAKNKTNKKKGWFVF